MKNTKIAGLSRTTFAGRPFLLVLFIAIEIFIVLYFLNGYRRHDNLYREHLLRAFDTGYLGATSSYDMAVDGIFSDEVNRSEVLKLISLALDDDNKRDVLRNELHRLMLPFYERQTAIGIWQVHFHLKDGTSFLRMHAPEKYGDNLFRRSAVYEVNKEQRPVKGYEVGYFADGYRFMYPLFYEGRHVGSVEFGITAEGISAQLNKIYPAYYLFMVNRTIVDNMTYADWKKRNYRESGLSDKFMIGQDAVEDAIVASINQKLRHKVRDRLAGMERFVEKKTVDGKDYLITFLPVHDVKGDAAAYFVQYIKDSYLANQSKTAIIDITLFTLLLAAIFYSIDSIQARQKNLEQKNVELENISNELEQYKLLSRYARDIILFIGSDGRIIEANEAAEKAYGYKRAELKSLYITHLRNGHTLHSVEEQMKAANERGIMFETMHRRRDGSTFPVEVSSVGVDIGNRRVLLSIIRDITERKKAERKLQLASSYNRSLIEASLDPLVTIAADGKITDVNTATEVVTGYSREELIGTDFLNYFTNPDKARAGYQKVFREGVVYDYELEIRHRDGHATPVLYNASVYRNEAGEVTGVFAAARDIAERKKADDLVRKREAELNESQRVAHIGSWDWDARIDKIWWSDEYYRIYNKDPNLPTPNYMEHLKVYTPESRERLEAAVNKAMETGEPYELDLELVHPDAETKWIVARAEVKRDADGRISGLRGTAQDITERKMIEDALKNSEERYRTLFEGAPDAIFLADPETGKIVDANPAASRLMMRPGNEIIGMNQSQLHPQTVFERSKEAFKEYVDKTAIGLEVQPIEHIVLRSDGTEVPVDILAQMITIKGRKLLQGVFREITERKKIEKKIQKSLMEKETLLREIHHRVKNNMQVITSLLNLQAQKIQDKNMKKPFEESEQRIRAMALVHERLYQREDLSGINFSDYINDIIKELKTAYRIDWRKVTTIINVEDIVLGIDSAIPCGLIINELITNCFKYAFPDDGSGEVLINFTKEDSTYNLTIRDNGVGLPAGFDYRKTATLGMQIVNVLTRQLLGTLNIRSDGGTEVLITFTKKGA